MVKQIIMRDKVNNIVVGGIQLSKGDVICAHCGQFLKRNRFADGGDFEILEIWDSWIDLSVPIRSCETWHLARSREARFYE